MAWFCAQCGSPNDPQMQRCRVCGAQSMPAQAQQQGYPQAGGYGQQPGPGYTQPAQPAGYGTPGFGQAAAPGGYGQPAAPMGGAPMGAGYVAPGGYGGMQGAVPAAARKKDDSGFKIGCAIAGCLGAGLVIASVLGVILIYSAQGEASEDRPSGDERRDAPRSGGLRDNVPENVGGYRAVSSRPLQVPRAVDAILVVYKSGSLEMEHAVAVFATEDEAQQNLIESIKRVVESAKVSGDVITIKNPKGEVIGLGSHFRANPEVFAYRIGKLMGILQGPPGEVIPFFQKLP
jgi:hypothetical protein